MLDGDVEEGIDMELASVMTRETAIQPPDGSSSRADIIAFSKIEPDVDPEALHKGDGTSSGS